MGDVMISDVTGRGRMLTFSNTMAGVATVTRGCQHFRRDVAVNDVVNRSV